MQSQKNSAHELCAACKTQVKPSEGVQCQGPCGKWRHYRCLDVSACKIQAVKTGELVLRCPCPDCEPSNAQSSIHWRAPCCKGQPCPTAKVSSTVNTEIDITSANQSSYRQLPGNYQDTSAKVPNDCDLSKCINPDTCPPCPVEEFDATRESSVIRRQRQKIAHEAGGKYVGGASQKPSQESERYKDLDDERPLRPMQRDSQDRRRKDNDDDDFYIREKRGQDDRYRSSVEMTRGESMIINGSVSKQGVAGRGYEITERNRGTERDYVALERPYGETSDRTVRADRELLRKSVTELKSSVQDLRMKQETVQRCFESVRLMCEAVDNLSRKINEVVDNMSETIQDSDREKRYLSGGASVDSRGKMCYCPSNPEKQN